MASMAAVLDEALSGRPALDAFAGFVRAKQELLALLQTSVEHDQRMLAEMEGPENGVSNSPRGG
jgi:hypothetical protein